VRTPFGTTEVCSAAGANLAFGRPFDEGAAFHLPDAPDTLASFADRTPTIENNAFYPQWQHQFEPFEVADSELSTITFMLYDDDADADDFMAYYSMPVMGLRSGYRTVPLLGARHVPMDHSCLFVQVWLLSALSGVVGPT
jgi:hypothetical protein